MSKENNLNAWADIIFKTKEMKKAKTLTDEELIALIEEEMNSFFFSALNGELSVHPEIGLLKIIYRNAALTGIKLAKKNPQLINSVIE